MKKLFTKFASLTLGLALVVGVGALLGNKIQAKSVSASETEAYILDGLIKGTGTSYNGDNSIEQDDVNWVVNGNVSMTPWRIGGHKNNGLDAAGTVRKVQSQITVSTENITKVVIDSRKPSKNDIVPTDVLFKVGTSIGGEQVSSLSHGSWETSITFTRPNGKDWSNSFFEIDFVMPANTTTTNKYIEFYSAIFYYESTVERGSLTLNPLSSSVIEVGETETATYSWDPLSSGATITSVSYESSDTDVLTVDNAGLVTAVAPGKANLTINAVDSNGEIYSDTLKNIYVSNAYDFEVGDKVALYSANISMELTSINKDNSTHFGEATAYTTKPNGTYPLTVEAGNITGSYSFKNGDNYLSWKSGNSLTTSTTKDDNSSWYVIAYDDYLVISNVSDTTREIWYNTTSPRFACYTGKDSTSTGYSAVALMVLEEIPVRGTIEITSPTDETMKKNATGDLTYLWTPAESTSTEIVSHSWSSNNSEVISVSGDTYQAVGAGKAKLTLNAIDETGQEYVTSTKDITVIDVVSGNYVKYTSVSDGDVVTLVCEEVETQISGLASSIGTYVFYETAPASLYDFTLVCDGDYFALKNNENKFLSWKSDANLELVEEATDESYWSISFDENDDVHIANKALDGEKHRELAFNAKSPRFAPYTTKQTAIQLYGPGKEIELSTNGLNFVNELLGLSCDSQGQSAPSIDSWDNLATLYSATGSEEIPTDEKTLFASIKAVSHETPVTVREKVEQAMAKYDYIVGKYGVEQYEDFIGRNPMQLKNITTPVDTEVNNSVSIIAVTVIALVSISSISVLLIIKKRKNY